MNKNLLLSTIVFSSFVLIQSIAAFSQDWLEFLGKGGVAKSADQVPTVWNEKENLLWKLDLPGAGSSSPIIVGNRVFVTCFFEGKKSFSRYVICVDKVTGKKLWSKEIPVDYIEDSYRGYIQEHGYASNTPASDGEHLFVFFGKGGVHSLDFDGNVKWSTIVGEMSSNRQWGSASSLLLHEDKVIVNASEEARAIIALDKTSGKEIWKQKSRNLELAYGTPRIVKTSEGDTELIFSAPEKLWGMDPADGTTKWFAKTPMTGNVSPSVIVDGDTIYSFGGYRSAGSISVRAGGNDDVSKTHVNWTSRTSSYVATPLLCDAKFYWIDDRGLANCSDATNGEEVYRERVKGLTGRPVYASPVLVDGKIYVVTRREGTIVLEPGSEFKELSRNKFADDDSDFNASPAVSDNKLFLRSNKALYCVGQK